MKRLTVDVGAHGVTVESWLDPSGDRVVANELQDVEPYLKSNRADKKAFAQTKNSDMKYGDFHKVATIPNVVINDLMRKGIWFDKKAMRKWLNESAHAEWRTSKCWL